METPATPPLNNDADFKTAVTAYFFRLVIAADQITDAICTRPDVLTPAGIGAAIDNTRAAIALVRELNKLDDEMRIKITEVHLRPIEPQGSAAE